MDVGWVAWRLDAGFGTQADLQAGLVNTFRLAERTNPRQSLNKTSYMVKQEGWYR